MSVVLGLDVSTTATKAVILDETGAVRSSAAVEYPFETPHPRWSEQDPNVWWDAAVGAIRTALGDLGGDEVEAVGLTGQMHGLVALDAAGPGPPSRDPVERSTDRGRMRRDPRRDRSRPADPGHGQRRAARVHRAEAPVGPATRARGLVPDRARPAAEGPRSAPADRRSRRGPGRRRRDAPVRAREARLVGRGRRRAGDRPVVAAADVRGPGGDRLGLAGGRRSTGLRAGTPVVAGGGDQSAAAVGVGAVEPGVVSLSLGTSGVVFTTTDGPLIDPEGRLHAFCHCVPDRWHVMGVMLSAAGSLRWFRDAFAPDMGYPELVEEAAACPGRQRRAALPAVPDRGADPAPGPGGAGRVRRAHDPPPPPASHAGGPGRGRVRAAGLARAHEGRRCRRSRGRSERPGAGARVAIWRRILADVLEAPGRHDLDLGGRGAGCGDARRRGSRMVRERRGSLPRARDGSARSSILSPDSARVRRTRTRDTESSTLPSRPTFHALP